MASYAHLRTFSTDKAVHHKALVVRKEGIPVRAGGSECDCGDGNEGTGNAQSGGTGSGPWAGVFLSFQLWQAM